MKKVLFLCTGNSCRSIMAEGLLNHFGLGRFQAYSAGSFPSGQVHPLSIATLKSNNIALQDFRSKSWDEFTDQKIDIVITVCDNAASEICPIFPGAPIKSHWSVSDPAHFQGSAEEIKSEFQRVYKILEKCVKALVELPIEKLNHHEFIKKLNETGSHE